MKKILFLAAVFTVLFASLGHAETVKIGGKTLNYNLPDGYVLATGGKYAQVLALMRQGQPKDIHIFTMFVPKDVDEAAESDLSSMDRYVTLCYSRQLQNRDCSTQDFSELKAAIIKQQGKLNDGELASQANQALKKVGGGQFRVGSVKSLGTFGDSKTSISFMALVTMSVPAPNGGSEPMEMGLVSTQLLAESKILTVNQYRLIRSPEDLTELRQESGKVIAGLGFKQGGASRSSFKNGSSSIWTYMWKAFLGAVIGGVLGGLGMFVWNRTKGKTNGADGQADKPGTAKEIRAQVFDNLKGLFGKKKG
ncbi:MAG: hypothetical protein LIP28_00170 [Deltaproteobacteria bacterium]|nr:hypothetical protein [Deltaproteobacteria bacterium]